MQIIPVVDLKNAQVVQAVRGKRSNYQAIKSKLCASSCPFEIVAALLKASQSDTIYIADLNAISESSDHFDLIRDLTQHYKQHTFWIDAGFKNCEQLKRWSNISNFKAVIGTESHQQITPLLQLLENDTILSLDFKDGELCGPNEILSRPDDWPNQVIVMSLDSVGSYRGPDTVCLQNIQNLNPECQLYAAGGVRDLTDLQQLERNQITGALIASALHDQSLTQTDILPKTKDKKIPR